MTDLDHESFDLGAVLSGITFPEEEVTVYFNEDVGYAIFRAEEELRKAEIRGNEEALKKLDKEIEELKEKAQSLAYTVVLKGVPESVRKACDKKSRDKFPVTTTMFGTPEQDPDRTDYFNALLWAVSIVKIIDPKGRVSVPSEDNLMDLREKAGRTVIEAITNGLNRLVEGPKAGFETAAQDVDFLSEASLAD